MAQEIKDKSNIGAFSLGVIVTIAGALGRNRERNIKKCVPRIPNAMLKIEPSREHVPGTKMGPGIEPCIMFPRTPR